MKTIKVIVVQVGKPPEAREIDTEYETLRKLVGGYLECVPLGDGVELWCNEEGVINGLPYNRSVAAIAPDLSALTAMGFNFILTPHPIKPGSRGWHHVHGDFFLARSAIKNEEDGYDLASVTDEDIKKYVEGPQ